MKKLTSAHNKVKSHIKARVAKKHAKKGVHQEHADNLYKLAHPTNPKRQKAVKRSLSHAIIPIALVAVASAVAIGAQVTRNNASSQDAPPVPANSVCRTFDGMLSSQDSRIGVTMNNSSFPTKFTFNFGSYTPNYLYAVDGSNNEYFLNDLKNNVLQSSLSSFGGMKVCIVNPGPAVPPFNSRTAMVNQQYKDFFGRNATASEQAYWAASGMNANQIINWFVDQDKAKRGPLVRLYKAYYKRWPDAGGYDYWIRKMKNGTTLTKVSDSFAASSEFKNTYGSLDNSQFVILVYNNVLDRAPDQGGYNYWVNRLNTKKISRGGVMLQFSESSEFKNKYGLDCELTGVTLRMLRRPATTTELEQWNPDVDPYALAYPIIFESSEYANRITP